MKMRHLLPLGLFLALLTLLAAGLGLDPREVPSPLVGKMAPQFQLPGLDDADTRVSSSDFNNQVTLLNVWASWCGGCRREHPLLIDLARKHDINLYGLNYKDSRSNALSWLKRFGDPYKVNAYDRNGSVGIDYGVYGVPETYVIDRRGVIRYKQIGPVTKQKLQEVILPLLEQLENEPV